MNNYNYESHNHNEIQLPRFQSSCNEKNLLTGTNSIAYTQSFHPEHLVTTNKRKHFASSCLPQIAIKRKDNETSSSRNTEVVLINGNWDTSNKIPNIIAEMHNVNIEELQVLQNTSGNKFINVDCPSPLGSDSGIEGDCSDGNLSWLLNYKINELPPVPDCNNAETKLTMSMISNTNSHYTIINNEDISSKHVYINQVHLVADLSQPVEIALEDASGVAAADVIDTCNVMGAPKPSTRYVGPKKPPFTYTELIEHALVEKNELTVSGIYQWISDHFPFYKQNDDRWKNSVRHNLSINPHFRKGGKAPHGAGHLWTIAQREDKRTWNIKKQRMEKFMEKTMNEYSKEKQLEMELATATASIMPEATLVEYHNVRDFISLNGQPTFQCIDKRQNIEVEYVIDVTNGLGDFLCPPVSKEQVVEECGLGNDFLITDLNPSALGLNLTEAEIINGTTVSNLYDDLNFHCYEMTTE